MTSSNYQDLFEDWEIGVAKNVIHRFKKDWKWLERIDDEDLLQECLTHWVFNKEKYDPTAGAKRNTFMARIISNRLRNIVREQSCDKRSVIHQSLSIDQPLCEADDSSPLSDLLQSKIDYQFRADLKLSVEQVFPQLTKTQQKLCQCLSEGESNMSELSTRLGLGRASIYREIKRIRNIFEDRGLKDFLK